MSESAAAPASAPASAPAAAAPAAAKKCSVCEGERTDYSSAQLKKKGQRVCKRCVDMGAAAAGLRIVQLETFIAGLEKAWPLNRSNQHSRITPTLLGAILYAYINKIRLCSKGAFISNQRALLGHATAAAPSARALDDSSDHSWVSLQMDDGSQRYVDLTASSHGGVDGVLVPGDAKDAWRAAKFPSVTEAAAEAQDPAKATKADYDKLVTNLKQSAESRQILELLKDAKMLIDKMLQTEQK